MGEEAGGGHGGVARMAGPHGRNVQGEQGSTALTGGGAAVSVQSGYTATVGSSAGWLGKEDVVFSDELNHASIIDGCRLSGARIVRFRHAAAADLIRVIGATSGYRRGMIIRDGVFSMDGDLAPLPACMQRSRCSPCSDRPPIGCSSPASSP